MTNMHTKNQGGSIVVFSIITVVVAVGLFVALYGLKQRSDYAALQPNGVASDTATREQEQSSSNGAGSQDDVAKKDTSNDTELYPAGGSNESSSSSSSASNTPPQSSGSGSTSATHLPQTGPSEVIGAIIVAGGMSFAAGTLIVSRRRLAALATTL